MVILVGIHKDQRAVSGKFFQILLQLGRSYMILGSDVYHTDGIDIRIHLFKYRDRHQETGIQRHIIL